MIIVKDKKRIKYLYHYTLKENVESILSSGVIKSNDNYTFFTNDYYKSISLFENEMMSNNYHITIDREIKRRSYADPDDYCIIKIPYYNDGKFVRFLFDNQSKNSIYSVSTIHEGNLYFDKEKAEVLDVSVQKGRIFLPKLLTKLAFLFVTFINPITTKADTWLDDSSYYSTDWFNPDTYASATQYKIYNAKQLAGLSYLANVEGYTFEGKDIVFIFPYYSSSTRLLDATEHDWVQLPESFKGVFDNRLIMNGFFCGSHYLLIGTENDGMIPIKAGNQCKVYDSYVSDIIKDDRCTSLYLSNPGYYTITPIMENGSVSMKRKAAVGKTSVSFQLVPDYGYTLDSYSVTDSSNNPITVRYNENSDTYSFTMPVKKVNINAVFKKMIYTIQIHANHATVVPEGPIEVEYLDNQSFSVRTEVGYELKGYQINDGEIIPINGYEFVISADKDMVINVVVEPIDYTLVDESENGRYIFSVEEEFDEIKEIDLCIDNECNKLKDTEYKVIDNKIMLLNSLKDGDYSLRVTFSNDKTSTIDFSVKKNKIIPIVNPETKANLLVLLLLPIIILGTVFFRKKQVKETE